MTASLPTTKHLDRRRFLGASAAAALTGAALPRTAAAARQGMDMGHAGPMRKSRGHGVKHRVDGLTFRTPEPAAGGTVREYWIAATSIKWDMAPIGRDDWMNMPDLLAFPFRRSSY